jgi:Tol biopolymer transport system component
MALGRYRGGEMKFATVLATVLVAVLATAASAWATFPGANGRIAFAIKQVGNEAYQIYSMKPDGSDIKRLTDPPGWNLEPRWSPDGRRLVFMSNRDGQYDIYVMNADGSGQTRLTTRQAGAPAWSPDGSKIAFASDPPDGGASSEIYVMNADGSGERRLTTTPPRANGNYTSSDAPAWSADDRIAFTSFREGDHSKRGGQLFGMSSDGSNEHRITDDPVEALWPDWSPDSTRLLYLSNRDTVGAHGPATDVFVVNADGTGTQQLTHGDVSTPYSWSPDGTKILLGRRGPDGAGLYTMNTDGSDVTRLKYDLESESISGADWAPVPPAEPKGLGTMAVPAPNLGETVNVMVVSGTVLVKTRASSKFFRLTQARQIKVGAQLNTNHGVVRVVSAIDTSGKTQSGDFGRGVFEIAQSKSAKAKGLTELSLKGGSFSACTRRDKRASAAKKHTVRTLFSRANGNFRTTGRYSAASGRDATWTVKDRCDGTLTTVRSGPVSVVDFRRKKTVKVKAGKSYLARRSR